MSQNVVSLRGPKVVAPDARLPPIVASWGSESSRSPSGLGVLFPLLGISIPALLLFDFVIVKHVPPLRRALGAS
jgi:hypothetical protein